MKSIKNFPLFFITLFMAVFISHSAFAAKTLTVGDASVNNTGDASSREFVLDIKAENFEDVNGLVFTLTFDDSVFEYVGLVQSDKSIDNKDYSETDENGDPIYTQPDATTIGGTIYYQANPDNPGRVLIAAAGANYFASSAAEYIPFKVKLRVKQYQGNGSYPIGLQQTIIGPETAANAGYTENVALRVAAGLAPDAEPETAQSFDVVLVSGTATVRGGYTIEGTVKHGSDPADGAEVKLFKKSDSGYHFAGETVVSSGEYSFSSQTAGTYQIRVHSLKPGFQRNAVSSDFEADTPGADTDIVLSAYQPLVGDVTLNDSNIPGLKVKVVKDGDTIGYFNVDENGHFVTTALPGSSGDYDIYAVYGGEPSKTAMTYGSTFNYELTLVDLEVSIADMNGKQYMVHVIQSDGKLEKNKSGTASANPETVTISNLISGKDYRVSVVGEGIPVTFYDDDADPKQTTVFSDSDLITLPHAAVVFDFSLEEEANKIRGSVTKDSSGQAVDVYAISTDFTNVYTTTSDDSDGSYSLDVTPGEYMVYGLDDGVSFYYETAEESTQKFSEKTIVDTSSGDIGSINIILDVDETKAYFEGSVTEKRSDGPPVANALIIAESSDRVVVSETDEQGAYRLEGFAADETATIFLPVFPGSEKTAAASNEGTEVDFIVNQGYTITGVVQVGEDDQDTVSGATVYLKDSKGKIAGLPVNSDVNGVFTLIDVTAGIYTVNAVHPQYKKYSDEIDVQGDESIVIKMTAGASINGKITDDETNNLEGVSVIILGNQKSYITTTDGNGTYEVKGLEHGQDYGVFTKKQGYVPQHVSSVTADTAGKTQNFTMPAVVTPYTFEGTITDDGSNVKDGSQVILYSIEVNEFMRTTTSSGEYSFTEVLGADDYNLLIRRTGKPPVKQSVGTINAENDSLDVNIEPATIEGEITLLDNQTGKTVLVYLVNKSQDVLKKVEATDAGSGNYTYTFPVRSGKKYKIAAFCEGYGIKWYNGKDSFSTADDVEAGTTTADISLTLSQ